MKKQAEQQALNWDYIHEQQDEWLLDQQEQEQKQSVKELYEEMYSDGFNKLLGVAS